jgi:phycocyanobilin:ferredoxin oxidoreductase
MTAPVYTALVEMWTPRTIPLAMPARYRHMRSPAMTIDNHLRASEAFRKVHVEHATTATGLDILHSVAYPRHGVDAPILGLDLVCVHGTPTMGICDLSGGGFEGMLTYDASKTREMPGWAAGLFSEQCVFVDRPSLEDFAEFVLEVSRKYAARVEEAQPAPAHRQKYRANYETIYNTVQRGNPRTFGVLANAFGPQDADAYMRDIMFG